MRRNSYFVALSLAAATAFGACASNSGNQSPPRTGTAGTGQTGGAGGGAGTSVAGTGGGDAAGTSGGAGTSGSAGTTGSGGSGTDAGAHDAGHDAGHDATSPADASDAAPRFGPITCTPGTMGDGKSTLPTSGDPPEWKLASGVTAGKVTPTVSFLSKTYNQHFPYWIYTSANYVQGQPAIFLMFGDGNQFLTDFHAATVLDNLTAAGDIPPTVALFVDPPSDGDRVMTYDPPTPKYTTFLWDELLPAAIFGKYTISRDADAWSIVGYSASGGQGWEVLWNKPDDVHKFLGDNTSFGAAPTYGVDWVQVIKNAPPRILRVSLLTSTNDLSDQRGMWVVINQNVADDLAAKGNEYRIVIGSGPHYPPTDGEHDFPNALRWMWRGCKFN